MKILQSSHLILKKKSITVGNANCTGEYDVDGIYSENGDTAITGSKLVITAAKGRGISTDNNILITDSAVDVESGASGIVAFKEGSECDVTITNSTVSVKAENWGINTLNDLTITDSTIDVKSETWGIECDTLTVDGEKTQICSAGGETGLAILGGANALTINSGSIKLVGGEMAFDAGENTAFTMSLPEGYELKGSRSENVFTDLQSVTLEKYSGEDEFYNNHTVSYVGSDKAKSVMLAEKNSGSNSADDYDDTEYLTVPVTGDENTVKVSATVSGSTATVQKIKDADLAKVTDGESVVIDLSGAGKNVDTARIPTQTVEKIAEKSSLTVKLPVAAVEFDKTATEEIADQAKGYNIELVVDSIKEVSLNAVQKESVGKLDTAIIIDVHLASNGKRICTEESGGFGGGKATIVLPYEIKNNRKASNYNVFYVNEEGTLQKLNAVYDEALKAFVFEIEHFSIYAVAYDENAVAGCSKDGSCPAAKFTDVDLSAWYHDGIHYCAANGLMNGVADTLFNPAGNTSRGMIVTMLYRLEGEPAFMNGNVFDDVEAGSWYEKAVIWAQGKGIVGGYGNGKFGPEDPITREQMAVILYNYAKTRGEGFTGSWMFLLDYEDRAAVSSWADEAMHWCVMKGIIDGKDGNLLDPLGNASRAEAAAMMQRFCEK